MFIWSSLNVSYFQIIYRERCISILIFQTVFHAWPIGLPNISPFIEYNSKWVVRYFDKMKLLNCVNCYICVNWSFAFIYLLACLIIMCVCFFFPRMSISNKELTWYIWFILLNSCAFIIRESILYVIRFDRL